MNQIITTFMLVLALALLVTGSMGCAKTPAPNPAVAVSTTGQAATGTGSITGDLNAADSLSSDLSDSGINNTGNELSEINW